MRDKRKRYEIRRLWNLGWSRNRISEHLGVSGETVDRFKERRREWRGKCDECGNLVMMPCRICEARRGITREKRLLFSQGD